MHLKQKVDIFICSAITFVSNVNVTNTKKYFVLLHRINLLPLYARFHKNKAKWVKTSFFP